MKTMKKQKMNKAFELIPLPLVLIALTIGILLSSFTSNAFANKDDLLVKVISSSKPIVAIAPDTATSDFTSSPVTIDYEYVGTSFPTSPSVFGTISVGMNIVSNLTKNNNTTYPLTVNLIQEGSGNQPLLLTANLNSFYPRGAGEFGPSTVTITTNCSETSPCTSPLEATLHLNGPNDLNTSTHIKVRITRVDPPPSCGLGLESFVTNQERDTVVNSTEVVTVKSGKNAGKVNSTTPFGQFSYNVLVANTCSEPGNFDLKITLDPSFNTNPNDNPGNAIFTYLAGSLVDLEGFDMADFSQMTPQGQTLCLQNVTLGGENTFLATAHMGIQRGIYQGSLPGAGTPDPSDDKFAFTAELFPAGSGCSGSASKSDTANITYTIK